jgi:hypothetical protein
MTDSSDRTAAGKHFPRVPDREKNNFRPAMDEAEFRTGRQYALDLAKRHAGRDWIDELTKLTGRQRDETEWHLQEDMVPPEDIRRACKAMLP